MDRTQKEVLVSKMRETLQQATSIVVAHQTGLTVSEVTQLRRDMREAGAEFKVLKNTLAQIAIKGTNLEEMKSYFEGPTALGYSTDPVATARVMHKFSEKNSKLSILGGFLTGQLLNASEVKSLANLPSLNELRSQIIALIGASATKLAIVTREPGTRIARIMGMRS